MAKEMKEKKEYKKRNQDEDMGGRYDDMDDGMDEGRGRRKFGGSRKRACRFTTGEEDVKNITYKNPKFLSSFLTEHGKIISRRMSGNSAGVQRKLALEVKRARHLALLGFINIGPNN